MSCEGGGVIYIRSIDRTKHWSRTSTFHTIHHITYPIITVVRIRNSFSPPPLTMKIRSPHHNPPPTYLYRTLPHPIRTSPPSTLLLTLSKFKKTPSLLSQQKSNSPHPRPTKGCLYMHNSFMTIQPPPPPPPPEKRDKKIANNQRARVRAP